MIYYNMSIKDSKLVKKCITLSPNQIQKIEDKNGVSFSDKIRRILDEYFEKEDE